MYISYFSVDFKDEATFTMTKKGRLKLLHEGFEFTKHKTNKLGITFWECSKTRRFYCKGKARTSQIDGKEVVKLYGVHNHLPDQSNSEF